MIVENTWYGWAISKLLFPSSKARSSETSVEWPSYMTKIDRSSPRAGTGLFQRSFKVSRSPSNHGASQHRL